MTISTLSLKVMGSIIINSCLKTKLKKYLTEYNHIALLCVLCLFVIVLQAQILPRQLRKEILQNQILLVKPPAKAIKVKKESAMPTPKPLAPIANPFANKNATIVYLEYSETLSSNQILGTDVKVFRGNVRFRHDNALLYSDSAYLYSDANSLDAFGHIRIVQGDTLFIYSDLLYYDGNIKMARLRHNVRMENRKTTLTTDSLNYDRMVNLAYYYTGGKIKDQLNTLTSVWGQYSPATKEALFKKTVHLVNKNFILDSDTMKYNTKTSIANIVGPTHILYNKETDIFTNRGWYNTATERMMLLDRSLVKQKDGKTMVGDTIFYDKKLKYAESFKWVQLNDTVQKMTLVGNYVNYDENKKVGMATDSSILVNWSNKDTTYIHADTLYTSKDSIYNVARGFYNVRLYRNDIQGLCDSLAYSARDSVINMYGEPVLWTENNQLSGEFIQAFSKNKKIERIHIQRAAMAVQHQDSIFYNQLSGKEIIAYMDSGQLKKVAVNGNGETIYYPRHEKDSTLIGVNKTQSSFVTMFFNMKKIERIVLTSASTGTMYPLLQLKGDELYLKNFFWLEEQRPMKKEDVLLVFPKTKRTKTPENSSNTTPSVNLSSKTEKVSIQNSVDLSKSAKQSPQ